VEKDVEKETKEVRDVFVVHDLLKKASCATSTSTRSFLRHYQ